MTDEKIPFNKIESDELTSLSDLAKREGITEQEWRAQNLPTSKLEFRWRYANKKIPLYERRLRSLREFNIGPAVQAWVRSRLEWVADNKLYQQPDGLIVLTVDPEGVVDVQQDEVLDAPEVTYEQIDTAKQFGSMWFAQNGKVVSQEKPRHASETFVRDLVETLGYEFAVGQLDSLDDAEVFLISDEYGIIPCKDKSGEVTKKLTECFDKLWAQK